MKIMLILLCLLISIPWIISYSVSLESTVNWQQIDISTPNYDLRCPPDFCPNPKAPSPVFDVPVDTLISAWKRVIARQPRVKLLDHDEKKACYDYAQRSKVFRFPDLITIQFIDLGNQSSFAILSRSIIGYSDLGVNKKRVTTWIACLESELKGESCETTY